MSDVKYIAPLISRLRTRPQRSLPENGGLFEITITTTTARFLEMLSVLQDGAELLGMAGVGDYNIDLLAALDTVREVEIDDMPEVGEIRAFVVDLPPSGWLQMVGQTVSGVDYPELYNVCPDTMKSGVDIIMPHMGNRALIGATSAPVVTDALFNAALGDTAEVVIGEPDEEYSAAFTGVNFFIYAGK